MKILLVESFFSGSHKAWAESYQKYSQHEVEIVSLPGRHWKWRMHGGAVKLAEKCSAHSNTDVFLVSDMIDLALFKSLLPMALREKPIVLYFHENQLTYPWSDTDQDISLKRDRHYGWINFSSALVADHVWWNSDYHKSSFLSALPEFLKAFPDHRLLDKVESIVQKSKVMYIGLDLPCDTYSENPLSTKGDKVILWNHRWEYDKGPDQFFSTLFELKEEGYSFKLIVCGEKFNSYPAIFDKAEDVLADEIIHFGFVNGREDYQNLLKSAHILPVCSLQDFFGISIAEAAWFGVKPILPRRLTYEELFSATASFYGKPKELKNIIISELNKAPEGRELTLIRKNIDQLHWSKIARKYDRAISEMSLRLQNSSIKN